MKTKRMTMMDRMAEILPTFQPNPAPSIPGILFNQEQEERPDNYIILAFSHRMPSATNSLASFEYWKAKIYVHSNSISPIDEIGRRVRNLIKEMDYEITYAETGDYYDMTLSRYRMEIEYRIPNGGLK